MDYVHACPFCGWSRTAATAVVIPAGCPECGCPADSLEAAAAPPPEPGVTAIALPSSRLLRAALALLGLVFVYAAARTGAGLLGPSGAIIAVGAAGFLLLPLVPERLPARGRR